MILTGETEVLGEKQMNERVWSKGGMILTGETDVLGDRSVPALFVHKQPYNDWPGSETDPPR
jgi:hypothetical protein